MHGPSGREAEERASLLCSVGEITSNHTALSLNPCRFARRAAAAKRKEHDEDDRRGADSPKHAEAKYKFGANGSAAAGRARFLTIAAHFACGVHIWRAPERTSTISVKR